jgi:Asp-tRNA(Asn)/Glu-tRNA(Gln) amidotransferase A subunit family amidase
VTELAGLDARELAAAVATQQVRASDVVNAFADVILQREPSLQAWAVVDTFGARANARRVDDLTADARSSRPLLGVPVGVKDVLLTEATPTGFGVDGFGDLGARVDAAAVARLRQAGAIVMGKTVTCAFAGPDPARTRNPWHSERSPGGSSAGSAAAVASGMVPIAIGTQTAGSVLRPAAFCGVVGFKPTFGRVSCDGVFPFAPSLDTVGCFSRSVRDAETVFGALVGSGVGDDDHGENAELAGLRLARLGVDGLLGAEVSAQFNEVVAQLVGHGVEVSDARLPFDLETLWAAQALIVQVEGAAVHARLIGEHPAAYGPGLRAMIELGHVVPGWAYAQARAAQRGFADLIDEYLRGFDLLILPTVGEAAPDRSTTGKHQLQSIATFLGLPAIALPTGFDKHGLPLSTQLIGRRGQDLRLLDHAVHIESAVGLRWPGPAPEEGFPVSRFN